MANNEDRNPRRTIWNLRSNINNIPSNIVRNQNVQHQVGQVVRGVIPGVNPQPEYHRNPYLQHLYTQHDVDGGRPQGTDQLDMLEAQLQEVIGQHTNTPADEEAGPHGHTHSQQVVPQDWSVLLGSFTFIILLALRLLADHVLGILVFLGLSLVFHYANTRMIEIVHITSLRDKQHSRGVYMSGLWLIVFLTFQIAVIYLFFSEQELHRVLYYRLPATWKGDVFDLFWVAVISDYTVRFGAIILKALVAVTPTLCLPQKRKGKYYMMIEMLTQLYRTTLPVLPWVHFLYDQPVSGKLIFFAILATAYVIVKIWNLCRNLVILKKAFFTFLTDVKYGVEPSVEEVKSRGENCPICQDDYQDPIMLHCKHIFCENCVSIWFDREKTCPMCRAEIQHESPVWQDGSTSAHLQWY
ncbi:RING finger and transmembrane domain-containing protein 2-like [Mya arenaria]|uniref:RING finger and transmembrane domain-containing protein 2-like n=1 Tax=Mya arenaria TaxID=6604 RepID=UPI0022E2B2BD|nr:RING finger and transmembrane domain-containing protein 2-like [Mya arenaria]XP_052802699.1 RING finger and transmembrane domain-containing protein 2-like [Mya arenaria]XP_052802700.1 RING finger and transmembrane domain-containing protein 2-like [Mya arenaria]XP_052802701.1 RING finger and transmembrane domain-containing protein 2-like [Mya arenaria]XP_052802702.1 RING finger and transmembrane domain-containing protein 2-like [Mya arenaria]XP_052802703.1 RING finger and transmembrane domai